MPAAGPTGWEDGFADGLLSSDIFVPFLTKAALEPFAELQHDSPCDNVLLEYALALELKSRSVLRWILPIFVGEVARFDQLGEGFSDFFTSGGLPQATEAHVAAVEAKLAEHLQRAGRGDVTRPAVERTVKGVLDAICAHQGEFLKGAPKRDAIEKVVAALAREASKARDSMASVPPTVASLGGGSTSGGSSAIMPSDASSSGSGSPREVITLCFEGDYSAFDEAKERKIKRVLAAMLDAEVRESHIHIKHNGVTKRAAARIGTGRVRVRVEIDDLGWAHYSSDSGGGSGSDEDATAADDGDDFGLHGSGEGSAIEAVDATMLELVRTKYWPLGIAQTDIEVIWKGEGSVVLVLALPESLCPVLQQLARLRVPELLCEGVRCCKHGEAVVQLDEQDDMAKRVERLRAVETEAREAIDKVRRVAQMQRQRLAREAAAAEAMAEVTEAEYNAFDPTLAKLIYAPDHFAALGLEPSSELSDADVSRAVKRASMCAHPDRNLKREDSYQPLVLSEELLALPAGRMPTVLVEQLLPRIEMSAGAAAEVEAAGAAEAARAQEAARVET